MLSSAGGSPSHRSDWSVLSSAQEKVASSWVHARQIMVAQRIVRRSLYSRQLGSIVLDPFHHHEWVPTGRHARSCVTWTCGLLVLIPVVALFCAFLTSNLLALTTVAWPWLKDGSRPDGCHASPRWMQDLLQSRVHDSMSQIHFPQPVLADLLHPRVDVLGTSVQIRNMSLARLEVNGFELSACYDDDRLAFPLLMPARSTQMTMRNVSFTSRAEYDVRASVVL